MRLASLNQWGNARTDLLVAGQAGNNSRFLGKQSGNDFHTVNSRQQSSFLKLQSINKSRQERMKLIHFLLVSSAINLMLTITAILLVMSVFK